MQLTQATETDKMNQSGNGTTITDLMKNLRIIWDL